MNTRAKIQSYLEMQEAQALLLEPPYFDEAIIGIAESAGADPAVAYDRQRVIEILMREGCESREEAEEYFEFNILGAYLEGACVFIDTRYAE